MRVLGECRTWAVGFVGLRRCYLGLHGVGLEIKWELVSGGVEIGP